MIGLTRKQAELLDYLKSRPTVPSYREMKADLAMASTSAVHRLVLALEERGRIRRIPDRARAIEVLPDQIDLARVSSEFLAAELIRRGFSVIPKAA